MKSLKSDDDGDDIQGDWLNQQQGYRDREEVLPLHQQRRLGLDIDMIGAREENLDSTRSQTLEMRSPSNQATERARINMDNWIQETCYMSAIPSGPDELNHFSEARNHHSPNDWKKWRETTTKNLYCMENKKVWRATRKTDVPKDSRLSQCKWVFKIKRNGTYRARLVALGYSQVPGVDFTDNLTPVVNDVTFRIALTRLMMGELDCMLMDVETAILYGQTEEEIIWRYQWV